MSVQNISADEALAKLKAGNQNFVNNSLTHPHSDGARKGELTGGQQPFAIILSCADSRVAPEYTFDQGLGDIFVIRVAGNIANTSSIASIEYAVAHLGVNLVVVMGHDSCGAVGAALAEGDNGRNLNHLLSHILPAVKQEGSNEVNDTVKRNAHNQCQELIDNSAIVSGAMSDRGVKVVPAYYHLSNGQVDFL